MATAGGGGNLNLNPVQSTTVGGKNVLIILFKFFAVSQIQRGPKVINFKLFFIFHFLFLLLNLSYELKL
jgi:hypothetical protein